MVACFSGGGGGAVALIAWAEFRNTGGYASEPLYVVVASLFGAIIGSISFWGSNIAFGKLQEIIPGRPITLGRVQQFVNLALALLAVGPAAAPLRSSLVLPIGGADMPVVISLLNAFTGLSAAASGIALNNTALIVAGMIVGASGSILTNLMAEGMNRSIPNIIAGGFGGSGAVEGAVGAGGDQGAPRPPAAGGPAVAA